MDHKDEQDMELEALRAIFMDDLIEYEGNLPAGWVAAGSTYKVLIAPDDEAGGDYPLKAELLFAHTPAYPEAPPSYRLRAVTGLSDADIAGGAAVLDAAVAANMGMAMIYALIDAAKEWIQGRVDSGPEVDPDAERRKAEEAAERKRAEARAHGTQVTSENFAAWKARFDAEVAAAKARAAEAAAREDEKARRLTGKAWFLKQAAAGEDVAAVDEADVLSEDDEEDFEAEDGAGVVAEEDGEEEDVDYEDDEEDEGMLDEL